MSPIAKHPPRVTLQEVAKHAGVSVATASRALNGLTASKRASRQVRQAAAELGYVVNEVARTLRRERTQTMGLIFHDFRITLGIEFIDAVSEAVEEAGYSLLIATASGNAETYDQLLRRFLERRVDAIFCLSPKGDGETLARYAAAEIPVLLMEPAIAFPGLPSLTPSLSDSTAELVQVLASLGHERLAVVTDDDRRPLMAAIGQAIAAAGMRLEVIEATEAGDMTGVIARLRHRDGAPTAVVAVDQNAHLLIASCQAAGISVPGDLSIVAVGQTGGDRRLRRGLSALVVDPQRVGQAAAASMLAWLAGARPAADTRVQAGVFHPGDTIGAARAKTA